MRGALPTCYGPGPDTNLIPRTTVEVLRGSRVIRTSGFPTNNAHHDYGFTLPSGHYRLRLGYNHKVHVEVAVLKGRVTTADFPSLVCV